MKKTIVFLMLSILMISALPGSARAGWWIFGKQSGGIRIHYLYLNKMSFDDSVDPQVTLFKGNLPDGRLRINGKASVAGGKIGAVQVSLDNQQTWSKARLSKNGSFEFSFTPELEKTYDLYIKIIDTTGKTNDVAASHKQVQVVDRDISQMVRLTLKQLFQAYTEKDPAAFMALVSPAFEGDEALLDSAIRDDFNTFDHIQLDFLVHTLGVGSRGRVFVAINYNRFVVSTRTGDSFSDHGFTELVFALEKGRPRLVRMKTPLMFGLSDATNVSTGTVNSGTNDPILLVDDDGRVSKKPFREAVAIIEGGPAAWNLNSGGSSGGDSPTVRKGSFTLDSPPGRCFDIASGANILAPGEGAWGNGIMLECNLFFFNLAYEIAGATSLDDVAAVSAEEGDYLHYWNFQEMGIDMTPGRVYALKLQNGNYAVLEFVSATIPPMGTPGCTTNTQFRYKYQSDGSPRFR